MRWQAQSNSCPVCRALLVRPLGSFSYTSRVQQLSFGSTGLQMQAKAGRALGLKVKVKLSGAEILILLGRVCLLRKRCTQVAFMTNTADETTEIEVTHGRGMLSISWRFDPKLSDKIEEWFASAANELV